MKRPVLPALLLVALAVLGACASEEVKTEPDAAPVTVTETVEAGGTEEATTEEATTEDTTTEETAGQANARESAEGYLEFSAFSRKSLIEQLKHEGYSTKDAT